MDFPKIFSLMVAMVTCVRVGLVVGHGRMVEPAARNVMWRFKYKNPRNYNDMGLNCGGFTNQFEKQRGKCGVCGDPWQGPREHEAGGKYARGVIARQYQVGSFINVTVELTSNHMGYFEFRLCPVNDPNVAATQACLDQNLLNILGYGTRFFISMRDMSRYEQLLVMLPPKLQCSQCVLQWKWVAGQSMGPDGLGGECLGCGNQEHFINCADIAIGPNAVSPLPMLPDTAPTGATKAPSMGPEYNVAATGYGASGHGYDLKMSLTNELYNLPKSLGAATAPSWNNNQQWQSKTTQPAVQSQLTTSQQNSWTQAPSWQKSQATAPAWNQQNKNSWQLGTSAWQSGTSSPLNSGFFRENFDWTTEPPANDYNNPTDSAHADYAGHEPGEYPEIGETPPSGPSGNAGNNRWRDSNYMKGFNDAIRQLSQRFGSAGNANGGNILNEIALSMQESQKHGISGQYGTNPTSCPDGVEPTCRSKGSTSGQSEFDSWCTNTCSNGICPPDLCSCTCSGGNSWTSGVSRGTCRSLDRNKAASMDKWCEVNCRHNNCPSNLCVC